MKEFKNLIEIETLKQMSYIEINELMNTIYDENKELKMVCRRLAATKSLEVRDKIANQCRHLFQGEVTRTTPAKTMERE